MERVFDKVSLIRTLKNGIKKGYWTMEQLDIPSPGWTQVVNDCEGHPLFPKGYQGVKYLNLARLDAPKVIEEKVELTDPKDLPPKNEIEFF
tara:strand:+ start:228 stop:500 length:273 start_codon:yes stop_codon:yes gene_type:complete